MVFILLAFLSNQKEKNNKKKVRGRESEEWKQNKAKQNALQFSLNEKYQEWKSIIFQNSGYFALHFST